MCLTEIPGGKKAEQILSKKSALKLFSHSTQGAMQPMRRKRYRQSHSTVNLKKYGSSLPDRMCPHV